MAINFLSKQSVIGIILLTTLLLGGITYGWVSDIDSTKFKIDGVKEVDDMRWYLSMQRFSFLKDSWYDTNVKCPRILETLEGSRETAKTCFYPPNHFESLTRKMVSAKVFREENVEYRIISYNKYGTSGASAGKITEKTTFIDTEDITKYPSEYLTSFQSKVNNRNFILRFHVKFRTVDYETGDYDSCSYSFGKMKLEIGKSCDNLDRVYINKEKRTVDVYFKPTVGDQEINIKLVDPPLDQDVMNLTGRNTIKVKFKGFDKKTKDKITTDTYFNEDQTKVKNKTKKFGLTEKAKLPSNIEYVANWTFESDSKLELDHIDMKVGEGYDCYVESERRFCWFEVIDMQSLLDKPGNEGAYYIIRDVTVNNVSSFQYLIYNATDLDPDIISRKYSTTVGIWSLNFTRISPSDGNCALNNSLFGTCHDVDQFDLETDSVIQNVTIVLNNPVDFSVDNSTVLLLRFEEGSGTTAFDETDFHNNGTITSAVYNCTDAKLGRCSMQFDGNDFINISHSDSIDIGRGGFTYSAWIKTTAELLDSGDIYPIIDKGISGIQNLLSLRGGGTNGLLFRLDDNIISEIDVNPSTDQSALLSDGQWHHVVAVADFSGDSSIYIDGIEVGSEDTSGITQTNNSVDVLIGKWTFINTFFEGSIDSPMILNRSLSATEVLEMYIATQGNYANVTNASTDMVLRLDFEEGSGSTAFDTSGQGNDGTITGATYGDAHNGEFGMEFDGVDDYIDLGTSVITSSNITYSLWVKFKEFGEYQSLISIITSNDDSMVINMMSIGNNLWGGNYNTRAITPVDSISLGEWIHIVLTSNGTTQFYLNGLPSGTSGTTSFVTLSTTLELGKKGTFYWFNGSIDAVQIINRSLSATEISDLYNRTRINYLDLTNTSVEVRTSSANKSVDVPDLNPKVAFVEPVVDFDRTGLVLELTFNQSGPDYNTTTGFVNDSSGFGNDGTIDGADSTSDGVIEDAFSFDGSDSITTNLDAQPSAMLNTTWVAWVKPLSITDGRKVFSTDDGFYDRSVFASRAGNGKFNVFHGSSWITPADVTLNEWQFIAVIFENGSNTIFYKNTVKYVGPISTVGDTSNNLSIGDFFNGSIDQVRIWNRTLSATEIQDLYDQEAYLFLNTDSAQVLRITTNVDGVDYNDTTVFDSSGFGNNGTREGGMEINADNGLILDGGGYDGVDDEITGLDVFEFNASNSSFTISVWVNPFLSRPGILWIYDGTSAIGTATYQKAAYGLSMDSGNFRCSISNTSVHDLDVNTVTTAYTVNEWSLVICTMNSTHLTMFKDGILKSSAIRTINPYIPSSSYIGSSGGGFAFFNGSIDEVRIYNRTLSAEEIAVLYNTEAPRYLIDDFLVLKITANVSGEDYDGSTVFDSSGNGNDGTRAGGVRVGASDGHIQDGMGFDGSNDVINIPSSGSLNLSNTLTISAWINPSDLSSRSPIYSTRFANPPGSFQLETGIIGTNSISVSSPSTTNLATENNAISTNRWQHIVYVKEDATTQRLYINGIEQTLATDNPQSFIDNNDIKQIGSGLGGFFNGSIDQVRIYNRSLTAQQVFDLWQSTYSQYQNKPTYETDDSKVNLTGLVGHWSMDRFSQNITHVDDISGLNNDGEKQGNVSCGFQGFIDTGCEFDGVEKYIEINDFNLNHTSIAFWVKPKSLSSNMDMISKWSSVNLNNAFRIWYELSTNELQFDIYNNDASVTIAKANFLKTNIWQHISATYDNSGIHLYYNGNEITGSVVGLSDIQESTLNIFIGSENSTYQFFDGSIDQVMIFNRSLSAGEVRILYETSALAYSTFQSQQTVPDGRFVQIKAILESNLTLVSDYVSNISVFFNTSQEIKIFDLVPQLNSIFNFSNVIEISANVTSTDPISTVTANISFPNGTNDVLTLSLATGDKYNTSFTIPILEGNYDITFFADDNHANSATNLSNFSVNRIIPPNGSIIISPAVDLNSSLWMIDFGLIGGNVTAFNETLCGVITSSPTVIQTVFRPGYYALNYNAQRSSFGNSEKRRFSIYRFPRKIFDNTYRIFFQLNGSINASTVVQLDLNITSIMNRTGISTSIDSDSYRLYRINRNGFIKNESSCLEQPIEVSG